MEELLELLEDIRPDVDFKNEKQLISGGVLDSLDVVMIIDSIEDTFDTEIKPAYLTAENMNSAEAIWALIRKMSE